MREINQFKIQNDALYETRKGRGHGLAARTKFKIKELFAFCLLLAND